MCQVDTTVATTTMAADNTTTPLFNETTTADEETTTPSGETTPDPVSEVYWNHCIQGGTKRMDGLTSRDSHYNFAPIA